MNEKEKARILDRCLSAYLSGEWSRKECLSRYPQVSAELSDLFSLAQKFDEDSSLDFKGNQKRAAKARMLNRLPDREQVVTNSAEPRYKWQIKKRRFAMTWVFIVTTLLSVLTGTGVVYASGDSLPGDMLYPVKQWKENVQLLIASDEGDAELFLEFTEYRVQEMKELMEQGRFDDLDEAVEGYQNQTQAMQQLMAGVNAENPDEAVRLRTELEQKLQGQARQMQELLDEESSAGGDQARDQLRIMLETNDQTRLRINEVVEEEVPGETEDGDDGGDENAGDDDGPADGMSDETPEETEETNGNGMQERNAAFVGASGDEQQATFRFQISNAAQLGVYAEMDGSRYSCTADGDVVTCNIPNADGKGTLNLYCLDDNSLLYSYDYDYEWLGTKESGEGGSQNQGSTGGGSSDSGQSGSGSGSSSGKGK